MKVTFDLKERQGFDLKVSVQIDLSSFSWKQTFLLFFVELLFFDFFLV